MKPHYAGCCLTTPGTPAAMPNLETKMWQELVTANKMPLLTSLDPESSPQRAASLTCVPSSGTVCLSWNCPLQTFVGAWHGALPAGCSVAADRLINSHRRNCIPGGAD